MIQNESRLCVVDNTRTGEVLTIRCLDGSVRRFSNIRDIVICVVKQAAPGRIVKRGDIVRGVIVCAKRGVRRDNGAYTKFDDNAVVLIKGNNVSRRTHIFGPTARELHDKDLMKIASLVSGAL